MLVQLLFVVAGFAAATLASGWAADETSGRLELLLATPLGQPMVGEWDTAGVVACLVLAAGGLALSGLGFARRDVRH